MRVYRLGDIEYKPIVPMADNDEIAKEHTRLILYHGDPSEILIAPKGELYSGWVIGIDAYEV